MQPGDAELYRRMLQRMVLAGLFVVPNVLSEIVWTTVQRRAEDLSSCAFLETFEDDCLVPVLGAYGTFEAKTNMEGACEVMFSGLEASGLPESRNCTANAVSVMDISTVTLGECKVSLGTRAYTVLADFKKTCVAHASADFVPLAGTTSAGTSTTGQLGVPKRSSKKHAAASSSGISLREASVRDVQPNARDMVHTVWLNGPTYSKKIENNRLATSKWPAFESAHAEMGLEVPQGDESEACNPKNARYSGFDANGKYCYSASNGLDNAPHLTLHSGWVGLVLDAGMANGNVLPKFGAVPHEVGSGTTAEIYAALPESNLEVTLTTSKGVEYKLGKQSSDFAVVSAVRQGIVTTHILVTDLVWSNQGVGIADIDIDPPQWWLEFEVRGTSMAVQLGWDELNVGEGCAVCEDATIQMKLATEAHVLTKSVEFVAGEQFDSLSLVFEAGSKSYVSSGERVEVRSETCAVNYRNEKNDVVLEVPASMDSCGYGVACSPLIELDFSVSNPNSEDAAVHLTISRNFPSRIDGLVQSNVGAEITGLTAVLRDSNGQSTGIPMQISKKWDEVSTRQVYEAGYDYGAASSTHPHWWTMNYLLRIPAQSEFSGVVAVIYNEFGNVASTSAAQLSLIGYTDSWTWLQQALGSQGGNIGVDTLGIHARSSTPEIRAHLFDGSWSENIGGADFMAFFNADGSYVYPKAVDVDVKAPGPCLSKTTFSHNYDDAIRMEASQSGARTDDWVKNFYTIRYDVTAETDFSRLSLFEYDVHHQDAHGNHKAFHYGSVPGAHNAEAHESVHVDCVGDNVYPSELPFRQAFDGEGPWWMHLEVPMDTAKASKNGEVGLIVRSYDAVLGGVHQKAPAFSVLCNKFELSVPESVGNRLLPGDYVEMQVELHVLPRIGAGFDFALAKEASTLSTPSSSLALFSNAKHATGLAEATARRNLRVTSPRGRVESHHPIRVCAQPSSEHGDQLQFRVEGSALGYVPIVLCGLSTHAVGDRSGLWVQYQGDAEYTQVDQSHYDKTDFWQTNFDAISGTYELVFNVEILAPEVTHFAWGYNPNAAKALPSAASLHASEHAAVLGETSTLGLPAAAELNQPQVVRSALANDANTIMPTLAPSLSPTRPSPTPTHIPTESVPSEQPTLTVEPTNTPLPTPQPTPLPTAEPSPVPTPVPSYVPTIHVECSALRCSELGWDSTTWGTSSVCGETDGPPFNGCSGQLSWSDARARCQAGGARLCSAAELVADEARATGCNYDTALVWSQDRCDRNDDFRSDAAHVAAWGSSLMGNRTYCLNGTALGGKTTAAVRCCADVDPCDDPTPNPTPLPTPLPSTLPTQLPTIVPTSTPTLLPSFAPTAANVTTDCGGNSVPLEWLGDGFCDAGYFDYLGSVIDLNCSTRAYDGGDCTLVGGSDMTFPEEVELTRTCTACVWNTTLRNVTVAANATGDVGKWYLENVTSYDCPVAPVEWVGDGVCDAGTYLHTGSGFVDLDCQAYAHDGYDCCTQDARYMQTFNGTAPACLTDARGPQTCADKYGPPPACWLTDAGGRTCDWLTSVLGGCDQRLQNSRHPHVDVRACADSCIFSNCSEAYAIELVATYYDMCLNVPSSTPTPAPSPQPTVTYERKIQCDVHKQSACATRTRGDTCTDWQLECFYAQCPSGLEANGRDWQGQCYRESPHVEDHRIFRNLEWGEPVSGWHQSPGKGLGSGDAPLNNLNAYGNARFEPALPSDNAVPLAVPYAQNDRDLSWALLRDGASSTAVQKAEVSAAE